MSETPADNGHRTDRLPAQVDSIPGLARVAATAWWHTAAWTVSTTGKLGGRVLRAALSPSEAAALAHDVEDTARRYARDLAGVADIEERVRAATAGSDIAGAVADRVPRSTPEPATPVVPADPDQALRERGQSLLRLSSDVRYTEDAHPAYARILTELAPDEGRILRLFLMEGPQPTVDVRTGGPIGMFSSELIAPGLSMIGPRAGCRYVDRVPSYLNNLFRLGLIWFSRETLSDSHRYQVIEAQPDVLEAMKSVRFAKLVRRSIHLTPFGEDFCRRALALNPPAGARGHAAPSDLQIEPQPG